MHTIATSTISTYTSILEDYKITSKVTIVNSAHISVSTLNIKILIILLVMAIVVGARPTGNNCTTQLQSLCWSRL